MADSSSDDKGRDCETETDKPKIEPTIVGGRPLAKSQSLQGIPRGIEVLIKKASVDPEFRSVLLEKRASAATEIELELSAAEAALLNAIPATQIEKIIENAKVPDEHRRLFLGKVAAAMLAVLGLPITAGCMRPQGIRSDLPEDPTKFQGMRPDWPDKTMRIQGTKVRSGDQQLRVKPVEKSPSEVDVVVGYECPFDYGVVSISFQKKDGAGVGAIDCRPSTVLVPKGKGEVTFYASGKLLDTYWLQALVSNGNQSKLSSQSSETHLYQAGEFVIKDSRILHVIEFRKAWIA